MIWASLVTSSFLELCMHRPGLNSATNEDVPPVKILSWAFINTL